MEAAPRSQQQDQHTIQGRGSSAQGHGASRAIMQVRTVLLMLHDYNYSLFFSSLCLVVCCGILLFITTTTSFKDHSWQLLVVVMYRCVGTSTQ